MCIILEKQPVFKRSKAKKNMKKYRKLISLKKRHQCTWEGYTFLIKKKTLPKNVFILSNRLLKV